MRPTTCLSVPCPMPDMQVVLKSQILACVRGLRRLINGIHTRSIPAPPSLPTTLQVVLKSQILAGGRGLGRFTNGMQRGIRKHLTPAPTYLPITLQVVLKSQILAGGRGLGRFTNGLQGGVHICSAAQASKLASQMLGATLVTKQTGPAGKPVNTLYVARKMKLAREMYFAILLDRKSAGPMLIGCSQGGTSIEDLAEKHPDKIIKIPVDPRAGITDAQADAMVRGLEVTGDKKEAAKQIKALYELFVKADCTMVEVREGGRQVDREG